MKATVAQEALVEPRVSKTPVQIVKDVKISHISAIDDSNKGLLPTRAGRKANATEQAHENMELVAVISVWSTVVVTPAAFSIECI